MSERDTSTITVDIAFIAVIITIIGGYIYLMNQDNIERDLILACIEKGWQGYSDYFMACTSITTTNMNNEVIPDEPIKEEGFNEHSS